MSLPCHVFMEEKGLVGVDDGSAAWYMTAVSLLVRGRYLNANVLVNSYSGNRTVRILDNDVGQDNPVARELVLKVYDVAGAPMRSCCCDVGEAFLELEPLIEESIGSVQTAKFIEALEAEQ